MIKRIILGTFLIAGLLLAQKKERNLITVTGTGEVEVEPNLAIINIGAEVTKPKAKDAFDANNKIMNRVKGVIEKMGIDKKDIKTIRFSLNPKYEYPSHGKRKFIGYELSHIFQVKVRKLSKVPPLLDKVTETGANYIGGISFTIDNPEKYESEARKRAVKNAQAKARELAEAAGVKLGKIVSISEGGYRPIRGGTPLPKTFSLAAAPPPIEPGQLKIRITVTLQYEISY